MGGLFTTAKMAIWCLSFRQIKEKSDGVDIKKPRKAGFLIGIQVLVLDKR